MAASRNHAVSSRPVPPAADWAAELFTVGITGTNGKTSTTLLVAEVLRAGGHAVAVETTIGAGAGSEDLVPRSTSNYFDRLQAAKHRGTSHFAIEVTSEALATGWAKRWRFDLGVFTNLTPDHLDAHGSFEHYLASKAQLFVHLGPGRTAVLNAADEAALLLSRVIPSDVERCWYFSPRRGPAHTSPNLGLSHLQLSLEGTNIRLEPSAFAEALDFELQTRLVGAVFAENALAAACVGLSMGEDAAKVKAGLLTLSRVPGRFEIVAREPVVVVDYAHTPDALARTCEAARELANAQPGGARLITVFGAGGNRDKTKRGPMGEAVGAAADIAIVTNDNPRDEDPRLIAESVADGCRRSGKSTLVVELDRRRAIQRAIELAHPHDLVVICGKGHETGQTQRGTTLPFDDSAVAREILGLLAG